jgi:hypothetical protein
MPQFYRIARADNAQRFLKEMSLKKRSRGATRDAADPALYLSPALSL